MNDLTRIPLTPARARRLFPIALALVLVAFAALAIAPGPDTVFALIAAAAAASVVGAYSVADHRR